MREALTNPMFELVPYEAGESGIMTHGGWKDTNTGLAFVVSQLSFVDGNTRECSIFLFQHLLIRRSKGTYPLASVTPSCGIKGACGESSIEFPVYPLHTR